MIFGSNRGDQQSLIFITPGHGDCVRIAKSGHSREGGNPELFNIPGFALKGKPDRASLVRKA